jgi:hypothetical protein
MGSNVSAGSKAVATTAAGGANQYYGYADANQTTVTAASLTALSSIYTIPAAEAYAGAAYELSASGKGTWGSTAQWLTLYLLLNGAAAGESPSISATAFATSANFRWAAVLEYVSVDGISEWQCGLRFQMSQYTNAIVPGTAADNEATATDGTGSGPNTATVSSPVTCAFGVAWEATTGTPTITCLRTRFRKVA